MKQKIVEMKKKIFLILIGLALIGGGYGLVMNKRQHLAHQQRPLVLPTVVEAKRLMAGHVKLTLRATAEVQALRDSVMASRLSGFVTAMTRFEGDAFKKGDILATIDPSQAQADMLRAEATLAQSRLQQGTLAAELGAADSTLKAEEDRLRRAQELIKIQGISNEQLQAAESGLSAARARQAAASAASQGYGALLKSNQAALSAARENLRYAVIAAPFDGVISQRLVQSGDLVTPGKPLLKITDVSGGSRLLVNVPAGTPALELHAADQKLPLKPWPEAGLQGLRRFEARSPGNMFTPGSRIEAQLVTFKSPQAILLPRQCLLNDDGHTATVLLLKEKAHVAGAMDGSSEGSRKHHGGENGAPAHGHDVKPVSFQPESTAGHPIRKHHSRHQDTEGQLAEGTPPQQPGNHQQPRESQSRHAAAGQHDGGHHHARSADTIEPIQIVLAAAGEEGAVSTNLALDGKRVACGSPDVLTRLLAGMPFSVKSGD